MSRPTCTRCQGSGEGWHADQRCTRCGGGGMEPEEFEDEDREVRLTERSATREDILGRDRSTAWFGLFL